MRSRDTSVLALFALGLGVPPVPAQSPPPRVFDGASAAHWIRHEETPGDAFGVFHFRRVLELPARPGRFVVHVSADNRYRLLVNGRPVSSGPQRSDLMHWRYETVDLAPVLREGRNVLAALVWNWGPHRPVAQFSRHTAFLLQGDGEREAVANTSRDWRVLKNDGYEPLPLRFDDVGGYYAAPPGESVDGRRYPWGWETLDFDDRQWAVPAVTEGWGAERAQPRGTAVTGEAMLWQLVPRSIPPMEETVVRFAAVRRREGLAGDDRFLKGERDLVVPPRTRGTLLVDQAHLTNAYAVLETSGGAGSTVTLTYAEALRDAQGRKGHRNEIEGKTIRGLKDVFRPGGGERRRFQTLWFRTYRYVQVDVETGDEPLRVHDLHGVFTGYPFPERGRFASGDAPWLRDVWEMNRRTARLCAWETFFDTPYYEQLQYAGDTRIQSLISLYMTGDDRLVRQALEHFDASRIPDGITASRYPSDLGQYIPPFSLLWVAMVHDYWMHRDDPAFVRDFLPGVRGVLGWYERHLDGTGLLGPMPWWNFMDWAKEWPTGIPPGAQDGHSTTISLLLAYALPRAAELEEALGLPSEGSRYRALARKLTEAARTRAWDPARGVFRDSPESPLASQQTNTLAVLADAVPEAEQRKLVERVLGDGTLVQATYYFGFYVLEALRKAGLADRYLDELEPWRGMLALGLTTTPENPEPTRSDSHAWSAHPNYGLLATVLGVRPAEPGFRSVRIAPSLGRLKRAEGRVPHPRGDIEVRLMRIGERGLRVEVSLPAGLGGTFHWEGRERTLKEGRQEFEP